MASWKGLLRYCILLYTVVLLAVVVWFTTQYQGQSHVPTHPSNTALPRRPQDVRPHERDGIDHAAPADFAPPPAQSLRREQHPVIADRNHSPGDGAHDVADPLPTPHAAAPEEDFGAPGQAPTMAHSAVQHPDTALNSEAGGWGGPGLGTAHRPTPPPVHHPLPSLVPNWTFDPRRTPDPDAAPVGRPADRNSDPQPNPGPPAGPSHELTQHVALAADPGPASVRRVEDPAPPAPSHSPTPASAAPEEGPGAVPDMPPPSAHAAVDSQGGISCETLQRLPNASALTCDCFACEYTVQWRDAAVLVRQQRPAPTGYGPSCDPKALLRQLLRQLHWGARGARHAALPALVGACREAGRLAVAYWAREVVGQDLEDWYTPSTGGPLIAVGQGMERGALDAAAGARLGRRRAGPSAHNASARGGLWEHVAVALQVARLMEYLTLRLPDGPYIVCDLHPRQFVLRGGAAALVQPHQIVSLRSETEDGLVADGEGRVAWRHKAGVACAPHADYCALPCVLQKGRAASEGVCPAAGRCAGVGVAANVFLFGLHFLRPLVGHGATVPPALYALATAAAHFREARRPTFAEVAAGLARLLCRHAPDAAAAGGALCDSPAGGVAGAPEVYTLPPPPPPEEEVPYLGCEEIFRLPLEKLLGCGCVSCAWRTTMRNRTVVVKFLSDKAGNCDRRHSINLFENQIAFAGLRLRHPNLIRIYGHCENSTTPDSRKASAALVVEYLEHGTLHVPSLVNFGLERKLRMAIGVAELLRYLGHYHPQRPGSPYIMCDFKPQQFAYTGGDVVKLVDADMMIPMMRDDKYRVFPPKIRDQRTWLNGRIFAGLPCVVGEAKCPMECLFGYKRFMSEVRCEAQSPAANGTGVCPGVGRKAPVYTFAATFLRTFLETHVPTPQLADLMTRATAYEETARPTIDEVVATLEAILAEQQVSPMALVQGYVAPKNVVTCESLQRVALRASEQHVCGCTTCLHTAEWDNQTVGLKRLSAKTGACDARHRTNILRNQIEAARLGLLHPAVAAMYGACEAGGAAVYKIMVEYVPVPPRKGWYATPYSTAQRLVLALHVGRLVQYLSAQSPTRSGSPYVLAGLNPLQFAFTDAMQPKLIDFDLLLPLLHTAKYKPLPPKLRSYRSWRDGRMFAGYHCALGTKCEMDYVLGPPGSVNMSEFECNRSLSASMAPVEGKGWNVTQMGGCGGIGTAANVYMYGKAFLRPFLSHRHVPRGMQELVQRTTDYQEPLRPDMDAVVQALEAMVQEEEAAPSAYTAPYFVPSAKGKGSKRKGHG